MNLKVLDLAEADLLAGFAFYESQSPGVGMYFIDTLHADIESLRLHAGVHRKIAGFHRLLSHRFPYAIYYRLSDQQVEIWRVLDCLRDPRWISNAIKRPPRKR